MATSQVKAGWANAVEAAAYLGYRPQTLANWRSQRTGPHFEKPNGGQVRYRYADLDAWMSQSKDRAAEAAKPTPKARRRRSLPAAS